MCDFTVVKNKWADEMEEKNKMAVVLSVTWVVSEVAKINLRIIYILLKVDKFIG
jgi:hypothetical protein